MSSVDVKPTSNRKPAGKAETRRTSRSSRRSPPARGRWRVEPGARDHLFGRQTVAADLGRKGAKARLPEPPRKPNPREAAIVRGLADSFALRLACHNDALHRRLAPESPPARALFDAVEQARVEAIGSRRMQGVASNITAMLDDRYHRSPFAEARTREEAPLEDAVAMLARERMTGLEPPRGAARLVELWRPLHRGEGRRRARSAERRSPRPARLRQAGAQGPLILGARERLRRRRRGVGRGDGGQDAARRAGRG